MTWTSASPVTARGVWLSVSDELWREVPDFPGYWISTLGCVIGRRGKPRKPDTSSRYNRYVVSGGRKFSGNVMVLRAFVRDPEPGETASHLNGKPLDDRLENLAWESLGDNLRRKTEHGTMTRGIATNTAKLTEEQVRTLRAAHTAGQSGLSLSKEYGIAQATAWAIIRRKSWAWLDA